DKKRKGSDTRCEKSSKRPKSTTSTNASDSDDDLSTDATAATDKTAAEALTEDPDEEEEEITEGEKRFWAARAGKNNYAKGRKKSKETADLRLFFDRDAIKIEGVEKPGVICKLCLADGHLKKNSFFTGNGTSQRRHLERAHPEKYVKICAEHNIEPKIKKVPEAPGVDGQQSITAFTVVQPGPMPSFSLEGLLEYIMELFVDSDQAMLLIDRPSFRRLIFYLRPKLTERDLPHRMTLTKAIKEKHESLIERDIDMIKGIISLISMTFDGWSKKRRKAF
ncbi:hypothetical protein K435DRAFT_308294, partial [Dendrothele bispora CBS 962.96]